MRILVTGANGLLGQKLVERLQKEDEVDLIATARSPLTVQLARGTYTPLDISRKEEVHEVLRETHPDVVVNTAAMTQVDQCESDRDTCILQNVTAVEYLVEACNAYNIHLIHISTDFIFDGSAGPLAEDAEPNPVNFYGESKLRAELLIRERSRSWCILRTVLVYGITRDMSRSNIVLWVKDSLEKGKNIQVVNDQWRTPTLAEDLAEGCYLAAVKRASGVFHISGKDLLTPYEIALETASVFGLDEKLITKTDSTKFTQPARRPPKTGFIIDKARRELGYNPHSFPEGLQVVKSQI